LYLSFTRFTKKPSTTTEAPLHIGGLLIRTVHISYMVTICFLQRKWKIRYLKELSNNMAFKQTYIAVVYIST